MAVVKWLSWIVFRSSVGPPEVLDRDQNGLLPYRSFISTSSSLKEASFGVYALEGKWYDPLWVDIDSVLPYVLCLRCDNLGELSGLKIDYYWSKVNGPWSKRRIMRTIHYLNGRPVWIYLPVRSGWAISCWRKWFLNFWHFIFDHKVAQISQAMTPWWNWWWSEFSRFYRLTRRCFHFCSCHPFVATN